VTREQVDAAVWLNNGLPSDLCDKEPRLKDYGFYRKLDAGGYEFKPFCDADAKDWVSVQRDQYNNVMDQLLPKPSTP